MKKFKRENLTIIGFPMDLVAGRRGVDMGTSALRIAGLHSKFEKLGYKVTYKGDINISIMKQQRIHNPKLKYLNKILKTSKLLAARVEKVLKHFRGSVDHIHISFDVDSVDPAVAPGIGTPVPGGLSYREAHLIMESIAECGCMSSLEVAEVNRILDHQNRTAVFTTDLIASSMGQRII